MPVTRIAADEKKENQPSSISATLQRKVLEAKINSQNNKKEKKFQRLVSDLELEKIRDDLVKSHPREAKECITDSDKRDVLIKIIKDDHRLNEEAARFVVSELFGMSFLEEILKNEDVSDIGWNGRFLTVEGNETYEIYYPEDMNLTNAKNTVEKIVKRFATIEKVSFNETEKIFYGVVGNLRIAATHEAISPEGTTFSLRVIKSKMVLTHDNFQDFAPEYIYKFIEVIMKAGMSGVISGRTGSGKTELFKLMTSKIPPRDRVGLIEDVAEANLGALLPNHNISSYVTDKTTDISDLIEMLLRYFPKWVNTQEVRGKEALDMIAAARTDHNTLCTLHAKGAFASPMRLVSMSSANHNVNEETLMRDILEFYDLGFHIEQLYLPLDDDGKRFKIVRYLSEIVAYSNEGSQLLFHQEFEYGRFYATTNPSAFPKDIKKRMGQKFIRFELPESKKEPIEKSPELQPLLNELIAKFDTEAATQEELVS